MQINDLLLYVAIATAGLLALPALVLTVLAFEARRGTLLAEDSRQFLPSPAWAPARARRDDPAAAPADGEPLGPVVVGTATEPRP